jgi:hypothetical protein
MTTSGTTSFAPNFGEIADEAFERAGMPGATSGYHLRTARRSMNFMFQEWANRGINLWTVDQQSLTLVPGTQTYTLPSDTVDVIEGVLRNNSGNTTTQQDIALTPIDVGTWSTIPNKLTQANPVQYYVQRLATPIINFWPIPNSTTTQYFIYWRLRQIQDAGLLGTNTMDVPNRFLPAMVAGLAYYMAMKNPDSFPRLQALKQVYDEEFVRAATEDRSRSSVQFVPGGYGYA